jgi:hypothetical protein
METILSGRVHSNERREPLRTKAKKAKKKTRRRGDKTKLIPAKKS